MGTDAAFMGYVCEQAAGLGPAVTHKKMFGEYALYVDGKVVAFVCDNEVFLKPNDAARALLPRIAEGPPYPGAKMYWMVNSELDDHERFAALLRTTADALPAPKPKMAKPKAAQPKAARKAPARKSTTAAR